VIGLFIRKIDMSLSGYRRLLKSAAILFSKDEFALLNAKKELRSEFLKNKNVIDTQELGALLRGIEEVDEMIRFNVVQGSMNERGNFGETIIYFSMNSSRRNSKC
jgi:hypothetical protein